MNKYLISELALEQGLQGTKEIVNGFRVEKAELADGRVSSVRIPQESIRTDVQKTLAARAVSTELRRLIPPEIMCSNAPVTVICLGNPSITSDSLGHLCADRIAATRAIKATDADAFWALGGRELTVLRSGTAGHSGIDACELLLSCKKLLNPALIIAIDSLKAVKKENLASVIQLSTVGITPGSGVQNTQAALNSQTLGVPVISIGSPTAISCGALICDSLRRAGITTLSESLEDTLKSASSFTVSASDVDRAVKLHADIISRAINLTFLGFAEI